ncbi:MAG: efflux RND transporter periplasmic adaptor subunit [Pseudomonadales bacterium]|nr:efflux RND transporter periplasmic adaptor subunit [Pseudomonadales bacterium]
MPFTKPPTRRLGHLLLGLLVIALTACSDNAPGQQQGSQQGGGFGPPGRGGFGPPGQRQQLIPSVEVVRARIGTLPLEERLTGRVSARNQADIYSEVAGPVMEIHVENGDLVKEGDPLLRLRDVEFRERFQQAEAGLEIAKAQTRQAEANLALLKNQLERTRSLVERQLETESALETLASQVAVAEADLDLRTAQQNQAASLLEERRLQLANTVIRAPVSGRIGRRNAERGMMVNTSTPLFTIGDLDNIQIEVLLTERMLSYIAEGTPVNLYSENWSGQILQSEISRISPFLDPNTMRTTAQIEVANDSGLLRSGMFITVDILYGNSEQAVLIPNSAFYRHPRTGIEGVFVVTAPGQEVEPLADDNSDAGIGVITPPQPVSFVPIQILANGRMASGVRGIEAGDWVVTVGQNLLTGDINQTRARLISWDRMMELQQMQNRDLFQIIDQKQQSMRQQSNDDHS